MTKGRLLAATFLLALVMGPGPGSMIFDGTRDQPDFLFGIPVLYLWVVFWFLVIAGCIVVAARTVWIDHD